MKERNTFMCDSHTMNDDNEILKSIQINKIRVSF